MSTSPWPFVSVIIPCRNEEKYIRRVLSDLDHQHYPRDSMEAWIMDGMSSDQTLILVKEFAATRPWVTVCLNERKIVPVAMNEAIRKSKGSVIVRMDAHAAYPRDYISKLVDALQDLKADNVGGIWKTEASENTPRALAISSALAHRFGVGNALFRVGAAHPVEADTVPFGCFRRDVFERFGYYDERLVRNQDIELNKRIKLAGGKIFLVPGVQSTYFSRASYRGLAENNFKNGEWVILTSYFTGTLRSLSIRHFIPLFFALYLLSLPVWFMLNRLLLIPAILYLLLNIYFSLKISIEKKSSREFIPLICSFILLHLSYGAGSLYGLIKLLFAKKK